MRRCTGPVEPDDVHILVEEHLKKGRIVPGLLAVMHGLLPEIAWLNSRKGALPAQKRIVLERAGWSTRKAWKITSCTMVTRP